ncbi:MAG: hypothetical protein C0436_02620 [Alphaproteobacteria bacterium]|nr:hypothetical protein [Alphaproteobacteria bacterium]
MSAAPDLRSMANDIQDRYKQTRSKIDDFVDGTLYEKSRIDYEKILFNVCHHFATYISNVHLVLNGILETCRDISLVDDDITEQLQDGFFELEDFVDFVVLDFSNFKAAVDSVGYDNLPKPCRIRFNDVHQSINSLHSKVMNIRCEVMTYLHQNMSSEALRAGLIR